MMFRKMSHFLPDILKKDEWRKHAFYLIIGIGLLFILFSNPFLKVPFDVWEHPLLTQSYHDEGQFFMFSPNTPIPNVKFRYSWYIIYSTLFKVTGSAKNYRNKENIGLSRIVLFNLSFICLLIFSSKFLFYNVLYQNTCSVFNMLDRSKVGLQYTGNDLQRLKKIILSHEEKAGKKSENPIYFLSGKIWHQS